ncbi:MAG: hypothetical protein K2X81_24525 [Candidatus Obscuribacterales bacterium]|nr:hypothetical protein [Candidatus Obscuribacterales bacterium]
MFEILGFLGLFFFGFLVYAGYVFVQAKKKFDGPKLPNEQELMTNQGVWRTSADFPVVWERTVRVLTTESPLVNYSWRVQAELPYKEIILTATVDKEHGPILQATMTARLKFEPLADGGTIINYTYTTETGNLQKTNDICEKMKKITNHKLRTICAELSIDPTKGLPF